MIIIILIIMKKKETPEQTLSCKNRTNTGREKLVMRCSRGEVPLDEKVIGVKARYGCEVHKWVEQVKLLRWTQDISQKINGSLKQFLRRHFITQTSLSPLVISHPTKTHHVANIFIRFFSNTYISECFSLRKDERYNN